VPSITTSPTTGKPDPGVHVDPRDYATYYGDSYEGPGCIGAVVKIGCLDDTENGETGVAPT